MEDRQTDNTRYSTHKCPVCNGFGTLKFGSIKCHGCGGHGFVVVDNKTGFPVNEKERKREDEN